MSYPVIELKTARNSRHPWIFQKMVQQPTQPVPAGSVVEIRTRDGRFAGWGTWHPNQTIALRVLSENNADRINEPFMRALLLRARKHREEKLGLPAITDSYRLIYGEADGLSGIVIDKLGDVLVIEPYVASIVWLGQWIIDALQEMYAGCRILMRPAARSERCEKFPLQGLHTGCAVPREGMVTENGLRFAVDFAAGHKTGFFLDQRENRALAARFCAGKSALDLCCYTGGFSLSATAGGAARVTGVDLDEKAIVLAKNNAALNRLPREGQSLEFIHADVFEYLRGLRQTGEQADVVILDPPKLAHTREDVPRAETMYADFNRLAAQAVKPGGLLITCSCSGLVSEERFGAIVARAVVEAGRKMEVLEMRGAAADHPVIPEFPEGKYLTALFARIS